MVLLHCIKSMELFSTLSSSK